MSDNKDELEKEELKDVNSNETSKDNKEDDYEKICYVCRRPESKAGKMIDMPGGICVCTDCLQKSFNNFQNVGMNVNISEEELKNLLNMPGVHMMNPEDFIRNVPHKQKIKKKKADGEKTEPVIDINKIFNILLDNFFNNIEPIYPPIIPPIAHFIPMCQSIKLFCI